MRINNIIFIMKFIFKKDGGGKYNFIHFFPFLGVIIGCITVSLTFAIMEGMEYAIFSKLEKISFSAKIDNIDIENKLELNNFLNNNDLLYNIGLEDDVIIMKNENYRQVALHAIENINEFKKEVFHEDLVEKKCDRCADELIIGKVLADKLGVVLDDSVLIVYPYDINIFTGLPYYEQKIISGIFDINVLDYNLKHLYTNYNFNNMFSLNNKISYFLDKEFNENQLQQFKQKFPNLLYTFWEDDHIEFISAMKLEKYTYSIMGFLIILIASFTLMSMMSLSVIQKIPQIGILMAIGIKKYYIASIYLFHALFVCLLSNIIGLSISYLFIYLNKKYNFISNLFSSTIDFDIPLFFNINTSFVIFFISMVLMVLASIYPSLKAVSLDPVDSIKFRR